MKNAILFIFILFLGNNLFLFSQEKEFITFEHKAYCKEQLTKDRNSIKYY